MKQLPAAICLMGPTASGKTALSVQLAQALDAEIISVDSALVYRGMDIGTAKPTLQERAGIVHHLIDILDPSESYSTGQFRQQALAIMQDITQRGKIPLLTGGTMLYFNSLFHGLAQLPTADAQLREELQTQAQQHGNNFLHQRLAQVDPQAAARIHPNDPQRVQRALEVYELTGTALSDLQQQAAKQTIPYNTIKLVLAPTDRKILHEKIALRFQHMLQQGLIEEVRQLYLRGDLSAELPAIRAVGYRQVWAYLQAEYDLDTMTEKGIIATRQLAKRQFTWLRRENDATWFETGQAELLELVLQHIEQQSTAHVI